MVSREDVESALESGVLSEGTVIEIHTDGKQKGLPVYFLSIQKDRYIHYAERTEMDLYVNKVSIDLMHVKKLVIHPVEGQIVIE